MKIQQHDGVVVDAARSRQGFAKRKRGGEVLRREREAPSARVRLPSLPIYIEIDPILLSLMAMRHMCVGERSKI